MAIGIKFSMWTEDQLFKESDFKNHEDPDKVPFIKVGKDRIETLDQAKQAVSNFAAYVS